MARSVADNLNRSVAVVTTTGLTRLVVAAFRRSSVRHGHVDIQASPPGMHSSEAQLIVSNGRTRLSSLSKSFARLVVSSHSTSMRLHDYLQL
jgi:hypothetical protein